MTEIRTTVELRHPADRVWRALTDPHLLPHWFASLDQQASPSVRFTLHPVDLPALTEPIEAELIEFDPPDRMVLAWSEAGQPIQVTCELAPTADGCRLTVGQTGGQDGWAPADRDERELSCQQALGTRLPAVLDWLAFRDVDFAEPLDAASPPAPDPPRGHSRRRRLLAGLAVVALATGAVGVVLGLSRTGQPPVIPVASVPPEPTAEPTAAAPADTAVPRALPGRPSRSPSRPAPSRSTVPSARAAAAPTVTRAGRAELTARYATVSSRLLGYSGELVLDNSGDAAGADWTVVVTLAGGATVSTASGASYRQEGREVTFTGAPVPPDGSVTFRFDVQGDATLGPKRPAGCAIGDQPCAGL